MSNQFIKSVCLYFSFSSPLAYYIHITPGYNKDLENNTVSIKMTAYNAVECYVGYMYSISMRLTIKNRVLKIRLCRVRGNKSIGTWKFELVLRSDLLLPQPHENSECYCWVLWDKKRKIHPDLSSHSAAQIKGLERQVYTSIRMRKYWRSESPLRNSS